VIVYPSSKWPAEEWILRLLESGLLDKPEPIQMPLITLDASGLLPTRDDGTKLCGDCGRVAIHPGNRRCARCYLEHKRFYARDRHLQRKLARAVSQVDAYGLDKSSVYGL
jgi:hypothetical protein